MERMALEVTKRQLKTKGTITEMRINGQIPAILYGPKREPLPLTVKNDDIKKVICTQAGMNILLDLTIDGADKVVARIRDYQADSIKRNLTHVDFQAIDLTKKMSVDVPLRIVGKSEGVKQGGTLEQHRRTLSIRCLPTNMPEHIEIDVSSLMIGDSVHINDVKLPEGAECVHDNNYTLISILAPMKEEVAVAAEAAPVEGAAPAAAGAPAAEGAAAGKAPAAAAGAAAKKPEGK